MSQRPLTVKGKPTADKMNTSTRRTHREVFFAHNGPGPYKCFHCETDVRFETVAVHHLNGNHEDNRPENLAAAHHGCHRRWHAIESKSKHHGPPTAEMKAKRREAARDREARRRQRRKEEKAIALLHSQ